MRLTPEQAAKVDGIAQAIAGPSATVWTAYLNASNMLGDHAGHAAVRILDLLEDRATLAREVRAWRGKIFNGNAEVEAAWKATDASGALERATSEEKR